jgi:hypothetical protein
VANGKGAAVDFVNQSGVEAAWTTGFDHDGRELLIVVAKATYSIPESGVEPSLAQEQVKLIKADEFTGEPGFSAPLHETDFSQRKPNCDVLLNGSAYAPAGRPEKAVRVSLRVGSMEKSFCVFGARRWLDFFLSSSSPELFTQAPISYDLAYGGADFNEEEPETVATYADNPVGKGYRPIRRRSALVGELLPNTAEGWTPISDNDGRYKPMAFGPIGRNFSPRRRYAGTYDQHWLDNDAPFWPADFNYAYFQCAPDDQQLSYLRGGEEVELHNLTADGHCHFRLPHRTMPVTFFPHRGEDVQREGVCDTLMLEPDFRRFTMSWRVALPLRQHMFELKQVIVGELSFSTRAQRRARARGKRYYANLRELISSRPRKRSGAR